MEFIPVAPGGRLSAFSPQWFVLSSVFVVPLWAANRGITAHASDPFERGYCALADVRVDADDGRETAGCDHGSFTAWLRSRASVAPNG